MKKINESLVLFASNRLARFGRCDELFTAEEITVVGRESK